MSPAFCLFENGKSYTALQIAHLLGRSGKRAQQLRWVRENVFAAGCYHTKVGDTLIATGDHLNLFFSQRAEGWNDSSS